jgi:hypothetical protein
MHSCRFRNDCSYLKLVRQGVQLRLRLRDAPKGRISVPEINPPGIRINRRLLPFLFDRRQCLRGAGYGRDEAIDRASVFCQRPVAIDGESRPQALRRSGVATRPSPPSEGVSPIGPVAVVQTKAPVRAREVAAVVVEIIVAPYPPTVVVSPFTPISRIQQSVEVVVDATRLPDRVAVRNNVDRRQAIGRRIHGDILSKEGFSLPEAASFHLQPLGFARVKKAVEEKADSVIAGEVYDPFILEPALYRIFSRLNPTPDAVLGFANQYGDLATVEDVLDKKWVRLLEWQEQIAIIRDMVNFADRVLTATSKRKQTTAHKDEVLALVNWLVESVRTGFEASEENGVISFKAKAHTLLDAMKLQLAEAIVLEKSCRDCEHCGKPFEVTPQVSRADRLYCSDNCRVKAYQRRRKQAIKMREDGDTLREIAKVLGSDMSTIKKWVSETDKEK